MDPFKSGYRLFWRDHNAIPTCSTFGDMSTDSDEIVQGTDGGRPDMNLDNGKGFTFTRILFRFVLPTSWARTLPDDTFINGCGGISSLIPSTIQHHLDTSGIQFSVIQVVQPTETAYHNDTTHYYNDYTFIGWIVKIYSSPTCSSTSPSQGWPNGDCFINASNGNFFQ